MTALRIKKDLARFANPQKAEILRGFFKTGKGEYGEGDNFLGVTVPQQRKIAKKYSEISFRDIKILMHGRFHEERLVGVLILVEKFEKTDSVGKKKIYEFYLENAKRMNNWDMVDLSAPKICGAYLLENKKERKVLYSLSKSKNLWERRISILSTYALIKRGVFGDTFKISEVLLNDGHDLIHKAVGWMLREVGKINQSAEEEFLKKHYQKMPRTMLRYAIERFDDKKRRFYMSKQ